MTLTILVILGLVALSVCLTPVFVMRTMREMSRDQAAASMRMTQAAEKAIEGAGQTAVLAYQEANQAGLMAIARASELAEASGTRSQEVLRDSQATIRHVSSLLFPTASPPSERDSTERPEEEIPPWEQVRFGTEDREDTENLWPAPPGAPPSPPPPPPGPDGWTVIPHTNGGVGWDDRPQPPPARPEVMDPEAELDQSRFKYERAKQVDPALLDPNP